eukprot:gene8506-10456_t
MSNNGFLIPLSGSPPLPIFQKSINSKKLQEEISIQLERKMESFFNGLCLRYCRVEVLDLSGCTDLKVEWLSALVSQFSLSLRKLITRRCKSPTITDQSFSEILRHTPKLVTLSIGEMPLVGDLCMESLLKHVPSITALGLGRCHKITDKSIYMLANSPIAAQLHTIGLNQLSHLSDSSIRQLGIKSPNLTIFSVSNLKNLTSDTLSTVFLNCPSLGSIDLSGCINTDDSVLEAISINCLNLFQLNISNDSKITSCSIKLVVQKCKLIRILFVSRTMVDDDCIISIIENLNLEVLYATGCTSLTDNSIRAFLYIGPERLGKMILNFSSCPFISQSLVSILHQDNKNLQDDFES